MTMEERKQRCNSVEDNRYNSIKQIARRSDFSIARILGKDEEQQQLTDLDKQSMVQEQQRFEWLQCTRYKPPRLPRSRRRDGAQRRKLGRNPRIPFSSAQVSVLEQRFRRGHYLSSADVAEIASFLALSETRVKIWFQNRRARERRDREATQNNFSNSTSVTETSHYDDVPTALRHCNSSLMYSTKNEHRSLSTTSPALAVISRTQIAAIAMSRTSPSAFAPVCPLSFPTSIVPSAGALNLTANAQTSQTESPDD